MSMLDNYIIDNIRLTEDIKPVEFDYVSNKHQKKDSYPYEEELINEIDKKCDIDLQTTNVGYRDNEKSVQLNIRYSNNDQNAFSEVMESDVRKHIIVFISKSKGNQFRYKVIQQCDIAKIKSNDGKQISISKEKFPTENYLDQQQMNEEIAEEVSGIIKEK